MIYPIWMTNAMRRKHYKVCVRPTRQGEFLIHNNAYKNGGLGYIVTKTIKDEWEAPLKTTTHIIIMILLMIAFLLLVVIGAIMLPIIVVGIMGWQLKIKRDEKKRFELLRPKMRLSDISLSKKRYHIEFASQYSNAELNRDLFITIISILIAISAAFWGNTNGSMVVLTTGIFGTMAGILMLVRLALLKKYKHLSFKYSLVAGDPVFIAIPEPDNTEKSESTQINV